MRIHLVTDLKKPNEISEITSMFQSRSRKKTSMKPTFCFYHGLHEFCWCSDVSLTLFQWSFPQLINNSTINLFWTKNLRERISSVLLCMVHRAELHAFRILRPDPARPVGHKIFIIEKRVRFVTWNLTFILKYQYAIIICNRIGLHLNRNLYTGCPWPWKPLNLAIKPSKPWKTLNLSIELWKYIGESKRYYVILDFYT